MDHKRRILMAIRDRNQEDKYIRDNYPESRFRDRRGREHYDNGRYAPMDNAAYGPYGYHDGTDWSRRDGGAESHYPMTPFVPPVYREDMDMRYRDIHPMDRIGFAASGEVGGPWEIQGHYRTDGGREMTPHDHNDSSGRDGGYKPLTRETAEAWVAKMKNADGSTGAHWTVEQTKQLQAQKGIGLDPVKFWVAMNMMYSDYFPAADKAGIGSPEFYADLAKAFLTDKDAKPDKLDRYYYAVVN